jgi:hypothetical protein
LGQPNIERPETNVRPDGPIHGLKFGCRTAGESPTPEFVLRTVCHGHPARTSASAERKVGSSRPR